jgi:alcohol dehydrogenase (cytochrome c)
VVGLDAATGRPLWKFNTIARPGEPNGESWNGVPPDKRTGGAVWTAGSYDPETGLAFFGPAPTYDTEPLRKPFFRKGVTNDALYTNATIALDSRTGKLAWYYQHVPNDQWDLDWAFERQIIHIPVNGPTRKLIITAGKEAIYDALDARTGEFMFSLDLGLQNLIAAIDPQTGQKAIKQELIPGDGKTVTVCPNEAAGKSWLPASFDQARLMLYVTLVEVCMDLVPTRKGRGFLTSDVWPTLRAPINSDGKYGRVQAISLSRRQTIWTLRQRAPVTTGALATEGDLVFAGDLDRWFTAYNAENGDNLWRIRLSDVPNAAPITYVARGKQYVAVVTGRGYGHTEAFFSLVPEIRPAATMSSAIWAFELAD